MKFRQSALFLLGLGLCSIAFAPPAILFHVPRAIANEAPPTRAETHRLANQLVEAAQALMSEGKYSETIEKLQRALTIYQEVGDRSGTMNAHAILAHALREQAVENPDPYAEAKKHYQAAIDLAQQLNDPIAQQAYLTELGYVYVLEENFPETVRYIEQAIAIATQQGDVQSQRRLLRRLGVVSTFTARYPEALKYFQRALALTEQSGDRLESARTWGFIAQMYLKQLQLESAITAFNSGINLLRTPATRESAASNAADSAIATEASLRQGLGEAYLMLGQPNTEAAIATLTRASELYQSINAPVGRLHAERKLGEAFTLAEQPDKALEHYQITLNLARQEELRLEEGLVLMDMGGVYEQRQPTQALDYFQQARAVFQAMPDRYWEAHTWLRTGLVQDRQNQLPAAIEAYQQTIAIVQTLEGKTSWEANLTRALGNLYAKNNQLDRALTSYQRALGLFQQVGDRTYEQELREQIKQLSAKVQR